MADKLSKEKLPANFPRLNPSVPITVVPVSTPVSVKTPVQAPPRVVTPVQHLHPDGTSSPLRTG